MSEHPPGFVSLFRRSRYLRSIAPDDASEEANKERSERERFAAACIGFCLKHSDSFRQHFWNCVCRLPGDTTPNSIEIEVEPAHWADLRLRANINGKAYAWVIECKAGAPLEPKQNFCDPSFTEPTEGYGALFCKWATTHALQARYVVLGAKADLDSAPDSLHATLHCHHRSWDCLLRDSGHGCTLEQDLFRSLAELGIESFKMSDTKKIRVHADLKSVADAWDVLNALGSEAMLNFGRYWRISAGKPEADEFYLGAFLRRPSEPKRTSQVHRSLATLLNNNQEHIAWIGYESGAKTPFRRSVWLYCTSEDDATALKKHLRAALPNDLIELQRDNAWCVLIRSRPESQSNDLDWFQAVLERCAKIGKQAGIACTES